VFRIVDPPEIQEETKKLLDAWMEIPEEESPEFEDYLQKHCSERMKEYLHECDEIRAYYGQDVRI
jgi:hypothetical protein